MSPPPPIASSGHSRPSPTHPVSTPGRDTNSLLATQPPPPRDPSNPVSPSRLRRSGWATTTAPSIFLTWPSPHIKLHTRAGNLWSAHGSRMSAPTYMHLQVHTSLRACSWLLEYTPNTPHTHNNRRMLVDNLRQGTSRLRAVPGHHTGATVFLHGMAPQAGPFNIRGHHGLRHLSSLLCALGARSTGDPAHASTPSSSAPMQRTSLGAEA